MCPSFLATRDERDSTRGRARVLQELANGTLVTGGWRSPEVHDVLDLCLSCKACASDCPAGVDMATYKSEVLHRSYRRRLRPVTHYSLGWLPRWARLAGAAPTVVNRLLAPAPLRRVVLRLGGMDPRRGVPAFAAVPFRRWWRRRGARLMRRSTPAPRGPVLLWVDSFSDSFSPAVARDAVRVLTDAGYEVRVSAGEVCCGLTWISTGQLDAARRRLTALVDAFSPHARDGVPIVGLEPSCTAVLRSDLLELLADDPRVPAVAAATRTLAELLTADPDWAPPSLAGVDVVAQPHCHQHATSGYAADLEVLGRAGASVTTVAGCCGLAGNFGMEAGHYDVSVAVAENGLLPALRADAGAVLLADGFSCRTQADDLAGRRGVHLAELLAGRVPDDSAPRHRPSG
jgi:Fe-S oxidoreductase